MTNLNTYIKFDAHLKCSICITTVNFKIIKQSVQKRVITLNKNVKEKQHRKM